MSPAKSKKQFRFMKAQRGKKVSKKTADEFTEGVKPASLPEAVGKKMDDGRAMAKARAAKKKSPKR